MSGAAYVYVCLLILYISVEKERRRRKNFEDEGWAGQHCRKRWLENFADPQKAGYGNCNPEDTREAASMAEISPAAGGWVLSLGSVDEDSCLDLQPHSVNRGHACSKLVETCQAGEQIHHGVLARARPVAEQTSKGTLTLPPGQPSTPCIPRE